MKQIQFRLAQTALVLLFSILTLIQIFSIPGQFAHMRETQGLSLLFEIALTAFVGFLIFCGQLSVVYIWKIIREMQNNNFFTFSCLKWINRLVRAFKISSATAVSLYLLIALIADDPGILVVLTLFSLFVFSLTLMASLLRDQIRCKVL